MIDYLVPEFFLNYDETGFVSVKRPSGGMRTKIRSVQKANLDINLCSSLEQLTNNFILVEPMFFRENPPFNDEGITKESLVEKLADVQAVKILYCTELELLRWPGWFLEKVEDVVDAISCNCIYQKNLWKMLGLVETEYLVDPIDTKLFFSGKKEPYVIATGWISPAKNSEFIRDLYMVLKDIEFIKTIYVGGSNLWGFEDIESLELDMEIRQVSDVFTGSVSQLVLARYLSESAFFVANTYHDCSSACHAEAISAGCLPVVGGHPLYEERYGFFVESGVDATIEKLQSLTGGWRVLPDDTLFEDSRRWAIDNVSFRVFNKQLNEIRKKYTDA